MADISIFDLDTKGSTLFSDSEGFVGFIRDVSEAEFKIAGGKGKSNKGSSSSSPSSSSSSSSSSTTIIYVEPYPNCGCP